MKIQISEHFTLKKLIRFVIPSIVMIIVTSIYSVVDGFFISNYAGKVEFASVNLVMPFIMMLGTLGFMVGAGGSALVSKILGEGDRQRANQIFSMLIYGVIIVGIVIIIFSQIFLRQACLLLGADEEMLPFCVLYGRITLCSLMFFMLQNVFQSLLVTAGKPQIGLWVTIFAGVANVVLDLVFVGILKMGTTGAGIATVISETIGGLVPLLYFASKNSSNLRLVKPVIDGGALFKTFTNGSSELLTYISVSAVNMLYNAQLIKLYGQNGVAAYGTIMYVNFIFIGSFMGYTLGVAPIVGFNYGSQNHDELKNIFKKSVGIIAFLSVVITALSMLLASPVSKIYVGYDKELFDLTVMAFRYYSLAYLIIGFNIFASGFFTALNNGGVSATISGVRTLLLQIVCILVLPMLFGATAIWFSILSAEAITLLLSVFFIMRNRKKYGYL